MEDPVLFGNQIKYFIQVHVLIFSVILINRAIPEEQCVFNQTVIEFYSRKKKPLTFKHGRTIKQRKSIHPLDFSCKCHFNQL